MHIELHNRGSRFLFNKGDFSKDIVHASAFFLPRGKKELSVCDSASITENEIWVIGTIVAKIRQRTLRARADFGKQTITELGLQFNRDDKGFDRHANLLGWPDDEQRQQDIAGDLARQSKLVVKP